MNSVVSLNCIRSKNVPYFLNAAREAFIEELKCKLENNHQEISSLKQELATSNNNISELEQKRRVYEKDIQNLSEKGWCAKTRMYF